MIEVMKGFFKGLGTLARPWWAWIGLLVLVNGVLPWFFVESREAKVVLGAFFLAGGLQMAIFRARGFVRLLGLGHIVPWLPLLVWLGTSSTAVELATPMGLWLRALLVLNATSLAIDFVDVGRYWLGDRSPSYVYVPEGR